MIFFRKNALRKIASAEELDKTIVIVGTKSWLMITTIVVMAVLFVAWSVFARISSQIQAPGIFLPYDGLIVNINTTSAGELDNIFVSVGDIIEKDGLVAELAFSDNRRQLEAAKEQLASENALFERIQVNIDTRAKRRDEIRQQQLRRIDSQVTFLEAEIDNNRDILDRTIQAFEDNRVTQTALTAARGNYFQSRQQLNTLLSNKEEQAYNDVRTEQQDEVRLQEIKQTIQSLEDSVTDLEKELNRASIFSPISGRIIEIKHIPGANLGPDQTVASLVSSQSDHYANAEKNLEFIAYVSIANGRNVKIGTEVNVAVDGYERNRYGFIRGVVTNISNFPVSGAGILSKLGNRNLVNDFTREGSVYEVTVRLLQSTQSQNRLLWSTDQGNAIENIEIGTLGNAEFVLDKTRPITKAIPALETILN